MRFDYAPLRYAPSRDAEIVRLCRGKRVLHIGACDSPYTLEKLQNGSLLHRKLMDVTSHLTGIDLDESAIELLARRGIDNILHMDMNELSRLDAKPEVIIVGETIEHLQNVSNCLASLKSTMSPATLLVISTPNCYAFLWSIMVLLNFESIHDDHKVGFSYGLLHQMLQANGLDVTDFCFTYLDRPHYPWWRRVWRVAGRLRKGFAETLLAVCQLAPVDDPDHPGDSSPMENPR